MNTNDSSPQSDEQFEINNNRQEGHFEQGSSHPDQNDLISETKSLSPLNSSQLVSIVPSNGSKASLNNTKKSKSSKTTSKTCCLL